MPVAALHDPEAPGLCRHRTALLLLLSGLGCSVVVSLSWLCPSPGSALNRGMWVRWERGEKRLTKITLGFLQTGVNPVELSTGAALLSLRDQGVLWWVGLEGP